MTDGPSDTRRVRLVRKRSAKRRRITLKRVRRPDEPGDGPGPPDERPNLVRSTAAAGPATADSVPTLAPEGGPSGRRATAATSSASTARREAAQRPPNPSAGRAATAAPTALLDDELPLDDEAREGVRKLARSMAAQILPTLIKRALTAGAEQLADEGLRRVGAEVAVPGELAGVVADRAQAFRGELSRLMAREIRELVSGATVSQEIQRLLTSVTFEIKTEIRLRPNDEAVAPSVRSRVRVKRTPDDER